MSVPFSDDQAQLLTANWRLIHHQPDTASGFSATLFENKHTGEKVLAIRGTAGAVDLAADAQLVSTGAALEQIVDLHNYWHYLSTAPGGTYRQATLHSYSPPAVVDHDAVLGNRYYRLEFTDVVQSDTIAAIAQGAPLAVVGHSLGGHLAFAFDRLFGDASAEVFTVNGAGFRESVELARFFDVLTGQRGTRFDGSGTNVYGAAGPELVTQDGPFLYQQGAHLEIYTERMKGVGGALGHGVAQHTDVTAVMDLFLGLDEGLAGCGVAAALARLNPIFEAASAAPDFSVEQVVNALGDLILGASFTPIAPAEEDEREPLYQAVTAIRQAMYDETGALLAKFSGLSVVGLAGGTSAERLVMLAGEESPQGHAYRYALNALNPFVIVGGADLYDAASTIPEFADYSAQYWRDRAAFLLGAIAAGTHDRIRSDGTLLDSGADYDRTFEDVDRDLRLRYPRAMENLPYTNEVTFSDAAQTAGDRGEDRIYGGASGNALLGGRGRDHLEGGAGDDVLYGNDLPNADDGAADVLIGGAGADVFYAGSSDTLIDQDGGGRIFVLLENGATVELSRRSYVGYQSLSTQVYRSEDGAIKVILQQDGTLDMKINPSITIAGFASGDFGIELLEASDPTARTAFTGTEADDLFQVNGGDIPITNAANEVQALAGNDYVVSGDGDDVIDGGEGNDYLLGNAGADRQIGGAGDDTLIGALGADVLEGGEGSDILIGDLGNFDAQGGDDVLDGGAGSDLLLGGDGEDVLLGGDGNDLLLVNGYGTPLRTSTFHEVADGWAFAGWSFNPEPVEPGGRLVPGRAFAGVAFGGAGDDDLYGGEVNDRLDGGAGADLIHAGDGDDHATGGGGDDLLVGDGGADILLGGEGNDRIHGGDIAGNAVTASTTQLDGADSIDGGAGDDTVFGGLGDDTIDGGDGNDGLQGEAGDDVIDGGAGDDLILGNAGADSLHGAAGNDQISGHEGDDTLTGGEGDDLLVGESGKDALDGGEGDDRLGGGDGDDQLTGGDGWDRIYGDAGDDAIDGGAGNDFLFGRQGSDTINGGDGDDRVEGGDDDDVLSGDAGDDDILCDAGNDTAAGGAGDDWLQGGSDADTLDGDEGDDVLVGEDGDDQLLGGAGDDQLDGGAGADLMVGGAGNDQALGGADADSISGGAGNDRLDGGDGNDAITGDDGNDFLWGGSGIDTLAGGAGDDLLDGGADADSLTASDGRDVLHGGDGDDAIDGGDGSDRIAGDAGNDLLSGGAGHDTFVHIAGDGAETIIDAAGFDTLRLDSITSLPGGVAITEVGSDLAVVIDTQDRVHISHWNSGTPIDAIVFGDGSVVTRSNFLSRQNPGRLLLVPGRADHHLIGSSGTDIFEVNGANDLLDGGAGDDAYLVGPDQTVMTIRDGAGDDTLVLGDGIAVDDLGFSIRNGQVTIRARQARIEIPDWQNNTIERIVFSNGMELDAAGIAARISNAPTVAMPIDDQVATEDAPFAFTVPAATFVDPDDALLQLVARRSDGSPLPSWLQFDPATRSLSGTPGNDDVGTLAVEVVAVDAAGSFTAAPLAIEVRNMNDAPIVASPLPDRRVTAGFVFHWTLPGGHFTDADTGDSLVYHASRGDGSALPAWLNFDAPSRTFSGSPGVADWGVTTLQVEVRDQAGAVVADAFDLVVDRGGLDARISILRGDLPRAVNASGTTIAGVGDVNGDGRDDVLLGTRVFQTDGFPTLRAEAHLVYAGRDDVPDDFSLTQLNGWNGTAFQSGLRAFDIVMVAAAGDINGDGFADLAWSSGMADDAYLIFGRPESVQSWSSYRAPVPPFPAITQQYQQRIRGVGVTVGWNANSYADAVGGSLVGLGDVNGDGYDDLGASAITATEIAVDPKLSAATNYGSVLFGGPAGVVGNTVLARDASGFRIVSDNDAISLAPAGDVNGDGLADVFVTGSAGRAYVVYGSDRQRQSLSLSSLPGAMGFTMHADSLWQTSGRGVGDINGDGYGDLAVVTSGQSGVDRAVRIVLGGAGMPGSISLHALDGSNGFTVAAADDASPIGDIDGDGIDDLAILADGDVTVLYGSAGNRAPVLALDTLSEDQGLRIALEGEIRTVAAAGDVEGDGYADLLLGQPERDGARWYGQSSIVHGRDFRGLATATGTRDRDVLDLSGADILYHGQGGDDLITLRGTGRRELLLGNDRPTVRISDLEAGTTSVQISATSVRVVVDALLDQVEGLELLLRRGGGFLRSELPNGVGTAVNVLAFSGLSSEAAFSLSPGSLQFSFAGSGATVHLETFDRDRVLEGPRDFDAFEFADGSLISYQELVARGFDMAGTDGDDALRGTSVTDRIEGGGGDDTIAAGRGDDVITGGAGNDSLSGGEGHDTFLFAADAGLDQYLGGAGFDTIRGSTGDDLLRLNGFGQDAGIEAIDGGGGSDVILGTDAAETFDFGSVMLLGDPLIDGAGGDDRIIGSWGDDRIDGGAGNDFLEGGAGDDVYRLSGNWGCDRITDGEGINAVEFGPDVALADLEVTRDGEDLILGRGENRLTITGWYADPSRQIAEFRFADGMRLDAAGMAALADADLPSNLIVGSAANDRLLGTAGSDRIEGRAGNDVLFGKAGDDILIGGPEWDLMFGGDGDDSFLLEGGGLAPDRYHGGAGTDRILGGPGDDVIVLHQYGGEDTVELIDGGGGYNRISGTAACDRIDLSRTLSIAIARIDGGCGNDTIVGTVGDDVINGGAGKDRLRGGLGNDCYEFDRGNGTDRVFDLAGDDDRVRFGRGLARDDLWFSRRGSDLCIDLLGSGDTLYMESWYAGGDYRVERFETAGGDLLYATQVEQLVQAMAAFARPSPADPLVSAEIADAVQPVIAASWQAAA